jgi:uncharacterized protein (TIGR02118 family)
MTFTSIVLYPRRENATFDLAYYKATHMPLVQKLWGPHGLLSWSVTELAPGSPAPYSILGTLVWKDAEAYRRGSESPATKEIMDDVKNFSSDMPLFAFGDVVIQSSDFSSS